MLAAGTRSIVSAPQIFFSLCLRRGLSVLETSESVMSMHAWCVINTCPDYPDLIGAKLLLPRFKLLHT